MAKAKRPPQKTIQAAPAPVGFDRWLTWVCMLGIQGGLLMPLLTIPGVYNQYTFSKMVFFQALLGLTWPAYLVLVWRRREFRPRPSWPLGGLVLFLAVMGAATLLAEDPWRGWWGITSRMTGLYALLHFLAWVVMASSLLRTWPRWVKLLRFQLGVGAVMALVALLQVPFPTFAMFDFKPDGRVSGLTGNPIFLATYLVFTFFLAAWFHTAQSTRKGKRVAAAIMTACALAMLASGSRGPMLGLVVGCTAALLTLAFQRGNRRLVFGTLAALGALTAGYLTVVFWLASSPVLSSFFQSHPTLARLFVLGDAGRAGYWGVTWEAILTRPWLGWGHENLEVAYVWSYRPVNSCTPFFEDRPHNLVLEVLASGGVVGLLAWGALWAGLFRNAIRVRVSSDGRGNLQAPLVGLLTAHLVQSLFAFDTPSSWIMLCLVCALLHFLEQEPPAPSSERAAEPPVRLGHVVGLSVLGAAGVALVFSFSLRPFYGSWLLVNANKAFGRGDLTEMASQYRQAAPHVFPYGDDWLLPVAVQMTKIAGSGSLGKFAAWRSLTSQSRQVASVVLAGAGASARIGPVYGRMLAALAEVTHDVNLKLQAGEQLKHNMDANPQRQNCLMDYADWLAANGRVPEAEPLYLRALELDPDNALVSWRAGFFTWKYLQDLPTAARLLVHSDECPCGFERSPLQLAQLAEAHSVLGHVDAVKRLAQRVDGFPREDTVAALAIAKLLEAHGLTEERNLLLRGFMRKNPALERYRPVVAGQKTLREVDSASTTTGAGP